MRHLFGDSGFNNMIVNPSNETLKDMASKMGRVTQFGSLSFVSETRNRSAKNTYIAGVKETGVDQQTIDKEEALRLVDKVNKYLETKEMIRLDKTMGYKSKYVFNCRLYITSEFARIPYMWNNTLFDKKNRDEVDFVSVYVPEWPERKIISMPEEGVTYILGTDYFGEAKKSFLRMGMYKVKKMGGLGLHAGSKELKIKDENGRVKNVGFIMFGLSGTGKTTLTIHDHGLQGQETSLIRQDDVIFMDEKGGCYGSENGFFIKTHGLDEGQKVLFEAATSKNSIFENVKVKDCSGVDFDCDELTSNGRGIVLREEIENTDDSINLEKANKMIFITRRNDIVPPVAKLTPELAAKFFMLGESIETSAGDPTKAGQSKRCVGTNPFIVGKEEEEGLRIYEILKKNPDMEAYLLNTGSIGKSDSSQGKKISIKLSTTIMKEIAKDSIEWKMDEDWGYMVPSKIDGVDMDEYDPKKYYSQEDYQRLTDTLSKERQEWLAKYEGFVI